MGLGLGLGFGFGFGFGLGLGLELGGVRVVTHVLIPCAVELIAHLVSILLTRCKQVYRSDN